jgi:CPA2 family monovalent cation:H+ antiporter-2
VHNTDLILTATGGLAAALILGSITERLRLSPIVGYLLAGVVVGPYTPGFSADRALAEQLPEIRVILLMFGVGLQFHVKELLAVRRVAVPGALVQSLVATGLGALAARAVGWDWTSGVVFGLALSVASTSFSSACCRTITISTHRLGTSQWAGSSSKISSRWSSSC